MVNAELVWEKVKWLRSHAAATFYKLLAFRLSAINFLRSMPLILLLSQMMIFCTDIAGLTEWVTNFVQGKVSFYYFDGSLSQ